MYTKFHEISRWSILGHEQVLRPSPAPLTYMRPSYSYLYAPRLLLNGDKVPCSILHLCSTSLASSFQLSLLLCCLCHHLSRFHLSVFHKNVNLQTANATFSSSHWWWSSPKKWALAHPKTNMGAWDPMVPCCINQDILPFLGFRIMIMWFAGKNP